jgi:hypothetical protein
MIRINRQSIISGDNVPNRKHAEAKNSITKKLFFD